MRSPEPVRAAPLARVRAIARKEWMVLCRDRFYLFMAIGLPVLIMIVLGYGMSYDVKNVALGVADLDHSVESRELVDAFVASGDFRLVMSAENPDLLDRAMDGAQIRAALVIPGGFARTLQRGQPAEVQILVDGSYPVRAEIMGGSANAVIGRFNAEVLQTQQRRMGFASMPETPRVDVVSRIWFNPTLDSKNYLVPGLLAISLLFCVPSLVSLTVTREKESGAILNVQTVPLARWEFVVGKLAPYAGISVLSYGLLLLTAVGLFRIPLRGSLVVLTAAALLFVVSLTALGLLVSMLLRTQVAAFLVTFVGLGVSIGLFYSGWLDPVNMLGTKGQVMSRLLPTADFMVLARGVFLKGLGAATYGRTLATLAGYALLFTLASVLAFRKRGR